MSRVEGHNLGLKTSRTVGQGTGRGPERDSPHGIISLSPLWRSVGEERRAGSKVEMPGRQQ